uniref:Uncharacterized protein n=1 Tax=Siphoviridae sp. ctL5G6 TaxID=2826247 RepID=A0A8S5NAA0_9CAUD|nr:MAG TPA: hypothetical protein [Siphoviridae sp. ctL5G6]DAM20154.1 MAG TPA: hypothetical protein [Caudoviricetes sp.]
MQKNRGVEPPPYSGGAPLFILYHIFDLSSTS